MHMKKSSILLLLLLTACALPSCGLFNNIIVEEDVVNSSSRIRTEFEYRNAKEWASPLLLVQQTIIRETGKDNPTGIRIFDRIQLQSNSFQLENRVYLLLDGKPFKAKVEDVEFERLRKVEEKRKEVLTADSTKVSVVTGYDRSETSSYKLTYSVSPEIVEKIKTCNKLRFRYYAGPDMITTTMSSWELNTLKKVLDHE